MMSDNNYKMDMKTMLPDLISYIISVGPMLMSPQVSIVQVAEAAAEAGIIIWKSVETDNDHAGGYQARFNDVTDRAWKYTWKVHKMDQLPGTGLFGPKPLEIPAWNWERVAEQCGAAGAYGLAESRGVGAFGTAGSGGAGACGSAGSHGAGTNSSAGSGGAGEDAKRAAAGTAGVSARLKCWKPLLGTVEKEIRFVLQDTLQKAKLPREEQWNVDRIASTSVNMTRVFFGKLYMEILDDDLLRPYQDRQEMLAGIKKIHESLDARQKEHAWMIVELQEIHKAVDMLFLILQEHYKIKNDSYAPVNIDVSSLNSIRKLSDGLWINWKTGWLAKDMETAMSGIGAEEYDTLTAEELRLISILAQSEGALVGWDELDARLEVGREEYGDDEDDYYEEKLFSRQAVEGLCGAYPELSKIIVTADDKGCRINAVNRVGKNKYYLYKGYSKSYGYSEEKDWEIIKNSNKEYSDDQVMQAWLRAYYNQTCRSFDKTISNSRIASDDKSGAEVFGDYTLVQAYINAYATEKVPDRSGDEAEYKDAEDSRDMESRIAEDADKPNSDEDDEEGSISSDPEAWDAYGEEEDDSEVMLDYVEKWFCQDGDGHYAGGCGVTSDIRDEDDADEEEEDTDQPRIQYGRLLVLHGQPGDGKTTFCSKAVYAHCKEGWLKDASQVLWFSLNNKDSETISEKKFHLYHALRLRNKGAVYDCDRQKIKGALIILDGYDELSGELSEIDGYGGSDAFEQFCIEARSIAHELQVNMIITSRTMCVQEELSDVSTMGNVKVASFFPMKVKQQEAMIDRMIELDEAAKKEKEKSRRLSGRRTVNNMIPSSGSSEMRESLEEYRHKLPNLRKKKALRRLLQIPSLFRMIVTIRFDDRSDAKTFSGLFGELFHRLMEYKNTEADAEKEYLKKYEEIASRIFYHGSDTCPIKKEDKADKTRELTFKFLTKSGSGETGHLGFLHRSFFQYFLARFIVSEIRFIGEMDIDGRSTKANEHFRVLFLALSTQRLAGKETFMWSLIHDLVQEGFINSCGPDERAASDGPQGEGSRKTVSTVPPIVVTDQHIRQVLKMLNQGNIVSKIIYEGMPADSLYARKKGTESDYITGAQHAVFNLISACAAAEKGYHSAKNIRQGKTEQAASEQCSRNERIAYGGKDGFPNICRLLQSGRYASVYLEGLNLDGCDLKGAYLSGAYLEGASLVGTGLDEANLEGARLKGCI